MSAFASLHAAIAAVCPINGLALLDPVLHTLRIDFQVAATQPQRDAANAVAAAWDWSASAQLTRDAQAQKAAATAGIDNGQLQVGDKQERLVRALALVVLDEINMLRAAVVPVLPARTAAQVVSAIKTKIAATSE